MKELFNLQDEITKKIVVSLQVELSAGETYRFFAKSTNNLEAWKHFVKGGELFLKLNTEDFAKAREHFEAALQHDPKFGTAMVFLAWLHFFEANPAYGGDFPSLSIERAFELVQKAQKLDHQNIFARSLLAGMYLRQRKYEKSIAEHKKSIAHNPNYAAGYGHLSGALHYYGQFEESINSYKKASRLNPKIPPLFLREFARSHIFLERYEEALNIIHQIQEHASKGNLPAMGPPLLYSFVYQELGKEEEARASMAEALKIEPNLSLEFIKKAELPYKNPSHLQHMLDAYRKSGMPEKAPGAMQ
jgi:tetratricopeptide (TPR) repeat protein